MKVIIWTKYGSPDGLQLMEVEKPIPKDNEVLIKIHAATASRADTEFRGLKLPFLFAIPIRIYLGLFRPTRIKILGTEFAGEVVAAGKDVARYQTGDQVYGYTGLGMGAYAEYMCLSEKPSALASVMEKRPLNLTYEEAAAVPFGGLEALHSLDRAKIQRGQKVLIVGAGGSIGTYSVQLAKHYGAEVTGVDSGGKMDMLRSIGADHVIDYTKEDYTKNGQKYDVIMDTIGGSPFSGSISVQAKVVRQRAAKASGQRRVFATHRSSKQCGLWQSRLRHPNAIVRQAV
jgi:NADPH:quinone reductase-like Zn-dependent oxidoreductase